MLESIIIGISFVLAIFMWLIYNKIDQKKLHNAIDTTSFKSLQKIENAGRFGENVYSLKDNRKIKFFYQGPENDWKKNLDESMIKKMNEYYQNDLKFFQYES